MVVTGPAAVLTPPPIAHAAAGCIGSALSLLLFYPLERARIELQAHAPDDVPTLSNTFQLDQQGAPHSHLNKPPAKDTNRSSSSSSSVSISSSVVVQSTKRSSHNNDRSIVSCLIRLRKQRQLYRGVQPVVATLALSNFIFFYALQACKQILSMRSSSKNTNLAVSTESAYYALLATSLAGIVNVLLTNPLWVVNLRLVQGEDNGNGGAIEGDSILSTRKRGFFDILQDIAHKEGVGQLWSGTGASLLLVSNPAIQLFIYEQGKTHLLQHHTWSFLNPWHISVTSTTASTNLNPLEAFFLGAISKGIATIVTYPLQLAQVIVRLQKEERASTNSRGVGTTPASTNNETQSPTVVSKNTKPAIPQDTYQHLMSQHSKRFQHTWDCIVQLYRKGGLRALYTGMDAKLLLNILSAAFTFLTYEQILMFITTGRI